MSHSPEQKHRGRNIFCVAMGAGMIGTSAAAGLAYTVARNENRAIPALEATAAGKQRAACHADPSACDITLPVPQPAKVVVVKRKPPVLPSEHLTTNVSVLTFGTGNIAVEGKGHLNYHASLLSKIGTLSWHSVQGTIFLEDKPVTLSFQPCLVAAANYTKAGVTTIKSSPKSQASGEVGQLKINAVRTVKGSSAKEHVTIDAGSIAACDMHIEDSAIANKEAIVTRGKVNNGYVYSFEQDTDKLIIDTAEAKVRPANIVNIAAADKEVKALALGFMYEQPAWRTFVTHLPVNDITVNFSPPSAAYEAQLAQKLKDEETDIRNQTKTAPDSKGAVHTVAAGSFNFTDSSFNVVTVQPAKTLDITDA